MKRSIWMVIGLCLAICLALCLAAGTIGAAPAEAEENTVMMGKTVYADYRVEPKDAEEQFLNGLFGLPVTPVEKLEKPSLIKARGTEGGESFQAGSVERKLYDALRNRIMQIDAGTLSSTLFTFSDAEFTVELTAEEIGVPEGESMFDEMGNMTGEAWSLGWDYLMLHYVDPVTYAVCYDCPYETFWRGLEYGAGYGYIPHENPDGQQWITMCNLLVYICVSKDYSVTGEDGTTDINADRFRSAQEAAGNARSIITRCAGLGNYAKLAAYKNEICKLTDYNDDAAGMSAYGEYGDPWQLVYVFDGDPDTKVVCEGYSKAFYYLCDQSDWNGNDVKVICVSGTLWQSGDGNSLSTIGAHMWNIVRMNSKYYLADVTNADDWEGVFLDGYDMMRAVEGDGVYLYRVVKNNTGGTAYLGFSFNDETWAMYQDRGWLNLEAEAADPNARDPYPNEYETADAIWGISETEVLPGEEFTVYVTYTGRVTDELTLSITQGQRTVQFTEAGNEAAGTFSASDTQDIVIYCTGKYTENGSTHYTAAALYDGPLTVKPGKAAPVPNITITGGGGVSADGAVSFRLTSEKPDPDEDYSDVQYEIIPVNDTQSSITAAGVYPADGTDQAITMAQIGATGFNIADGICFRLQARAYGPGYESETAESRTILVTGTRDEAFTITGSHMTGNDTAEMLVNGTNSLEVTVPAGVSSIQVCRGDNNWIDCPIGAGNVIQVAGLATETAEAPLAARYTTGTGERRYSNVILVNHVTTLSPRSGRCNDNISWTLYGSGKLVISGTGAIPAIYEMEDTWSNYNDEITEAEIGSGITRIGDCAFYQCANLTTVTVPATLTGIGDHAFEECESLSSITAANVDMKAQKRCYYGVIKDFSLPETVTDIGFCAFAYTPAFGADTVPDAGFIIPADTGKIDAYAFYRIQAVSIRMNTSGVARCEIGDHAFGSCTSLRYFQMEDSGNTTEFIIHDDAFDGCMNLIFIGLENEQLREYAEDHGFTYLENEAEYGNG